jgi:hypothetical protein
VGGNRTGCGGCVTILVLLFAGGLLLEAWQGSSTGTHVLMILVAVLIFGGLGALIAYGRRRAAARVAPVDDKGEAP